MTVYLTTGSERIQSVETALNTFEVSHRYLCPELALICLEYLESQVCPSNVLSIYPWAVMFSNNNLSLEPSAPPLPEDDLGHVNPGFDPLSSATAFPSVSTARLAEHCEELLDREAEMLVHSEDFEELRDPALLHRILCRDTLQVSSEMMGEDGVRA
ncbi:unnamed protein product [Darwinula stevensoni]|uniref:Uncharacterized protein n=1 Tax=Darwinula stevensoni TaxID=69355 RepID=A0A7R8XD28_9CRUS|nr:unnamed protein product [Darwinula stevensoni]CAG0893080.1 unnamed protein product [Darwinula stevensoni]